MDKAFLFYNYKQRFVIRQASPVCGGVILKPYKVGLSLFDCFKGYNGKIPPNTAINEECMQQLYRYYPLLYKLLQKFQFCIPEWLQPLVLGEIRLQS